MTVSADRPSQPWIPPSEFEILTDRFRSEGKGGEVGYLIDFEIDHGESERGLVFRYTVAPCAYPEHLATVAHFKSDSSTRSKAWSVFENDARSPPSNKLITTGMASSSSPRRLMALASDGSSFCGGCADESESTNGEAAIARRASGATGTRTLRARPWRPSQ